MFLWWHLSTCSKGTETYIQEYDSLEKFRLAIGLSKTDVTDYLNK